MFGNLIDGSQNVTCARRHISGGRFSPPEIHLRLQASQNAVWPLVLEGKIPQNYENRSNRFYSLVGDGSGGYGLTTSTSFQKLCPL